MNVGWTVSGKMIHKTRTPRSIPGHFGMKQQFTPKCAPGFRFGPGLSVTRNRRMKITGYVLTEEELTVRMAKGALRGYRQCPKCFPKIDWW